MDEADTFMFGNPEGFAQLIQFNACICFTATPDDGIEGSAESRLIQDLGFKICMYDINGE